LVIPPFDRSTLLYARLAGGMYLAIIVLGFFGEMVVRGSVVVPGDAAATLAGIARSPSLWRTGIAGDLLMHLLDLPVILFLYLLLKPVNRGLALLATLLNLVQTAVLAANKINLLIPLFLLEGAALPGAFTPEQLAALSLLAINAHAHGFGIGLIFFGVASLVRGYLIFHSGFLPKTLGVLLAAAGVGYLVNSFALLLWPWFAQAIFPGILVPALVGELALCLWLIVKGVDRERWPQPRLHAAEERS
jgi:hypothetical protein